MRKLALFSAGFAAAAAIFVYLVRDVRALWIAGACLVLSPLALKFGLRRFGAVFLGLAAGLVWCFGYQQVWLRPAQQLCGGTHDLEAEVMELPAESGYGAAVTVRLERSGRPYQAVLYGDETLLQLMPGDRVRCTARVEASGLDRKQGENLSLRADGSVLCLYAESALEREPGTPRWPMAVRLWVQNRIRSLYDPETAGLLLALVTGDQSALSDAHSSDLAAAGLRHAVAVSGLHVTILLSMIGLFCGYNPRLTALFGIPAMVIFVLVTGASPSACRAAMMQILLLAAPLVRREQDPMTSLAAASLLLLLQNPWAVASVSFQLSFAAVAGLFVFSGRIQRRLLALQKKPHWAWRFVISAVSPSISATVTTLPLSLWYFEQLSISAALSNLLALWAVSLILPLGLLSCLLGGLGFILAAPAGLLARYVLWIAKLMAAFPYGAASAQNLPLLIWTVFAYGTAAWLLLRKKAFSLWPLLALTAAFLGCILWGKWNFSHDGPVFRILDVGQGQCTVLTTDEFTAMVDCGSEYPVGAAETAIQTLHSGGQTHLDALVLTHYDTDHAGGVTLLLHRLSVGVILLPDIPDESGLRQEIEAAALAAGTPVVPVSKQTEVTFSNGKLKVFPPLSLEDDNNSGICVLATAAECDILITGDLDQYAEMRLLSRWGLPRVEVLVAGHHGAAASTSQILLDTVQPQVVAISAGAENPYGHPAPETLERISGCGAQIRRTDLDGSIVIRIK